MGSLKKHKNSNQGHATFSSNTFSTYSPDINTYVYNNRTHSKGKNNFFTKLSEL